MAKALSGGMMPISCVLANSSVMDCIKAGEHGSTFGGNPMAMAVAKVAVQTIVEEEMPENSKKMGEILRDELSQIKTNLIKEVRGSGLFISIELHPQNNSTRMVSGTDFSNILLKNKMLAKATHAQTLRFAPALIINEKDTLKAAKIIKKSVT